ncbi:MAG: ADP-ribosylation factor-like protein [Candidatus Hodarchaeales archaeon]
MAIGKILFFGQAGAGKTSIYKKYFINLPIEDILETKPTVLFTLTKPTIKIFDKEAQVVVFDLGGQSSYISSHLANDAIFSSLNLALFVIDVSEPELFETAIQYLRKAYERMELINEKNPTVAIFLHKYDPARQGDLAPLAEQATEMINEAGSEFSEYVYRTTLFDDSIKKAMNALLVKAFSD